MSEIKQQRTVVTRVSPDLKAELDKKAAEEMLPVASYVRRLIAEALRPRVAA